MCLDLGHKAVASEMPHPRVVLLWPSRHQLRPEPESSAPLVLEARFIGHSEEHLVLETPGAEHLAVGDVFYGIPWHVCPTVALHGTAVVVRDGRAVDRWRVTARERVLSV